jgi:hypothetical protein
VSEADQRQRDGLAFQVEIEGKAMSLIRKV